jgi:hypothetical protein
MGDVKDPRKPPLLLFTALSLSLHAGSLGVLNRFSAQPKLAFEPSSQTLVGATFDVDPQPPVQLPRGTTGAGATEAVGFGGEATRRQRWHAHAGSEIPRASSGPEAIFGAVGERFAADLATTFARAFAQTASADSAWFGAPYGPAGTAVVTLVLDVTGHLAESSIAGTPTTALRRGIERTVALLEARPLTAPSAVTKLRVSAQVTRDDLHDGLHGDVFALSGGSFLGDVGSAFFALPPGIGAGRRVDVELRLLR